MAMVVVVVVAAAVAAVEVANSGSDESGEWLRGSWGGGVVVGSDGGAGSGC